MKYDKAQRIIIAPIWPGQSWYTKLKNLSTKLLFLGTAETILEKGQRMKDKHLKLPPGNVGAFILDQSQTLQLTKLLRELKIVEALAYSTLHSSTTELAKLDVPERDLATFKYHSLNSRTVKQCYIFASSKRANEIARQLTNNPCKDNERLNQVSQQRGEIRGEGGNQLLSSSPSETGQCFVVPNSPYLTSGSPKICIPTRGEIKIKREFLRELMDRTRGMMLKVGWSAWNDNAEIRTIFCKSLISLIMNY
ncbi:MAG: hypothetical protein EZS28_004339 [Streblomastix strix]|uniref:Uncharacterized protein n=1 Tax=Streblomastix strix TaxID=222440 RepID=A0A5J4X0Y8_9EUKA|nr:MAG: hypothetical protein EZS28_004339 [Streblomastix strix]